MSRCRTCGAQLDAYDIGFYKKLVNRGAAEGFTCVPCTAAYFGIPEESARSMIRRFQKMGCTLFPPPDEDPPR